MSRVKSKGKGTGKEVGVGADKAKKVPYPKPKTFTQHVENVVTLPPIPYRRNCHGVFLKPPKSDVEKAVYCAGCKGYHFPNGAVLTKQEYQKIFGEITATTGNFLKFVWRQPINLQSKQSKNSKRMASGKRTGNRKPRKRNVGGALRNPNDWPAIRAYANSHKCADCSGGLHVYARKIGNKKMYKILFSPGESASVLYALWYFQREMKRSLGLYFGRDLVHLIMSIAFTSPAIQKERLRKDQMRLSCGCIYHMRCYQSCMNSNFRMCRKHHTKFL